MRSKIQRVIVICKHCGKEKAVYPSVAAKYNEFFCNMECRKAYRLKNMVCMARNEIARKRRRDGALKSKKQQQKICGVDYCASADEKKSWIKRMTTHPWIFQEAFRLPATEENIHAEARKYF